MRCAIVLCWFAQVARADTSDIVERPLVLAHGQIAADVTAEINIAPSQIGTPLSLAPDAWWGATSRLTIGVIHSDLSVDRIAPGASFCVRLQDIGCNRHYHGSGIDVRWSASPGIAPRARLLLRALDPVKPALLVGALLKWQRGRFAITSDPYLQIGLVNTDRGNAAALVVPIMLSIQPTCRWSIELRSGWNSVLETWSDGWHIPVYAGARVRATEHLDVAAGLGFFSLLGPQNTAKERAVFVTIGFRS